MSFGRIWIGISVPQAQNSGMGNRRWRMGKCTSRSGWCDVRPWSLRSRAAACNATGAEEASNNRFRDRDAKTRLRRWGS